MVVGGLLPVAALLMLCATLLAHLSQVALVAQRALTSAATGSHCIDTVIGETLLLVGHGFLMGELDAGMPRLRHI